MSMFPPGRDTITPSPVGVAGGMKDKNGKELIPIRAEVEVEFAVDTTGRVMGRQHFSAVSTNEGRPRRSR